MVGNPSHSRFHRWLREPLLHFLGAALLLFVAHRVLVPVEDVRDAPARITLTDDDLNQMTVAWRAQGRAAPDVQQLKNLVDAKVREEILYREALSLGLDKDDTIVKRRLAQKMDFLAEDISSMRDPAAGELRGWFESRASRFSAPSRVSFRHVYFSPDARGANARQDAARTLASIKARQPDAADVAAAGDAFMFQAYYAERTPEQVARVFGAEFANAVHDLRAGSWVGPLESGLGWHLVYVTAIAGPRVPAFEEVETEVRAEWMAEQRMVAKKRMYEAMRARYEIVLPQGFPSVVVPKTARE